MVSYMLLAKTFMSSEYNAILLDACQWKTRLIASKTLITFTKANIIQKVKLSFRPWKVF